LYHSTFSFYVPISSTFFYLIRKKIVLEIQRCTYRSDHLGCDKRPSNNQINVLNWYFCCLVACVLICPCRSVQTWKILLTIHFIFFFWEFTRKHYNFFFFWNVSSWWFFCLKKNHLRLRGFDGKILFFILSKKVSHVWSHHHINDDIAFGEKCLTDLIFFFQ